MLGVVALLGFVGCDKLFGLQHIPEQPDPPTLLPGPTNLVATAGDGRVDLKWDAYAGATEYYVKRGTISGDYGAPTPVSALRTTYPDTDVMNNTAYYYVVSARVTDETDNSNEAMATPMSTPIPSEYFVTNFTLGSLSSDFNGWAGMEILVGGNSLEIHALGRVVASTNTHQHTIKIIDKASLGDVASVVIDTAGSTPDQFQTAPLATPKILTKNTAYYVVSSESIGQDSFYHENSTVAHTPVATVLHAIKGDGTTPYVAHGLADNCCGPVTFQYSVIP
jgi:hypothetical protein